MGSPAFFGNQQTFPLKWNWFIQPKMGVNYECQWGKPNILTWKVANGMLKSKYVKPLCPGKNQALLSCTCLISRVDDILDSCRFFGVCRIYSCLKSGTYLYRHFCHTFYIFFKPLVWRFPVASGITKSEVPGFLDHQKCVELKSTCSKVSGVSRFSVRQGTLEDLAWCRREDWWWWM